MGPRGVERDQRRGLPEVDEVEWEEEEEEEGERGETAVTGVRVCRCREDEEGREELASL